jgi:putative glutathione S-transferase
MKLFKLSGALPPNLIIRLGKWGWTTMWRIMMSQLAPRDEKGAYVRPESEFRGWIEEDSPHPPRMNRYRLYVGMSCPWAHRTLVVRVLKGLQDAVGVTVVVPSPLEGGWVFPKNEQGCRTLAQFYRLARPGYTGRSTVPVLYDTHTKTIVNNESAEIIKILNGELNEFAQYPEVELDSETLRPEIEEWNNKIYPAVNNGVYRCGFAQTQEAYDEACKQLFSTLDEIDQVLETRRYLCGEKLTLADVRLFTTLFRFDAAYYGLFKCNRKRIQDYQHLGGYLRDIYQLPGIAETCDVEAVKQDYYGNLFPLNPGGIVPAGGGTDLLAPHQRKEQFP